MDSLSYRPDLDTLKKYFELPPPPFAVPEQRSDAVPDDPDTEFQPYLENMIDEVIDENLFQEIASVLKTNFDQMKWMAPVERISDFYWIVTKYLKTTQSLHEGFDKIAQTNRSELEEQVEIFNLLKSASKQNRVSIRLKFKLEDGSSATITSPVSIENAILSYFNHLKKDLENEAEERIMRILGDPDISFEQKRKEIDRPLEEIMSEVIESLEAKSVFVSEARKQQCRQIKSYLSDSTVNVPAEGHKYLIIGLLFDLAGQPFNPRRAPYNSLDDFDPHNLIDIVRKLC